jgi:hypothetical protein
MLSASLCPFRVQRLALDQPLPEPKENGTTTERGSSALRAAADAMIRIERDKEGRIRITNDKRKDDEQSKPIIGTLRQINVGTRTDGTELTSCVFESAGHVPASAESSSTALDAKHREALVALVAAGGSDVRTAEWAKTFPRSKETLGRRRDWLVKNGFVLGAKGVYSVTLAGREAVNDQSRPVVQSADRQSASHPVGVTMTTEAVDDVIVSDGSVPPLDEAA